MLVGGCKASYRNVDDVQAVASRVWADAGFEVVGYEGYQASLFGGNVWYIVRRASNDRVLYHGFIARWFNEYHIYNLNAIDALAPR